MNFKVGSVIQHKMGGALFRINAVLEEPSRYKLVRLDNKIISELFEVDEEKYQVVETPEGETYYKVGQVLLRKQGPPRIGLICKVQPGVDGIRHEYDLLLFSPQGEQILQLKDVSEKEVLQEFEVDNFKWIVMYGDPKHIVRKSLAALAKRLETELSKATALLGSLTYYEKILEQNEQS